MAIYHCSVKVASRSSGRSSVAAAAYRSGEDIINERDGVEHDYTRKGGIVKEGSFVMAPDHAPEWATERAKLWNEVEKKESGKKSQLFREFEIAMPAELTHEQQIALGKEFAADLVKQGMVVDGNLHDKNDGNPHYHMMVTMRPFNPDGTWGNRQKKEYILDKDGKKQYDKKTKTYKCRKIELTDWNNDDTFMKWRKDWERLANKQLELAGHEARIDHRSHKDRGIEEQPSVHMGPEATAMEKRGENTRRGDRNRQISEANRQLKQLQAQLRNTRTTIKNLESSINTATDRLAAYEKAQAELVKVREREQKVKDGLKHVAEINLQEARKLFAPAIQEAAERRYDSMNVESRNSKTYQVDRVKYADIIIKLNTSGKDYDGKDDIDKKAREIMARRDPEFTKQYNAKYNEYLGVSGTENSAVKASNAIDNLDANKNSAIKKYLEHEKSGLDDTAIYRRMLKDGFERNNIIRTIADYSKKSDNDSSKAFKRAVDIAKSVDNERKGISQGKSKGTGHDRGGSSRPRPKSEQASPGGGGGLSTARKKDEEDQIQEMMDKGMSREQAERVIADNE